MFGLMENITEKVGQGEKLQLLHLKRELQLATDGLCQIRRRNLILIGELGVGRSSFIRGLAEHLAQAKKIACLKDIVIQRINLDILLTATTSLLEELTNVIAIIKNAAKPVILAIDELDVLLQTDPAIGNQIISYIKRILLEEEIQLILVCNPICYQKFLAADPTITRCCQAIKLNIPTDAETLKIIKPQLTKLKKRAQIIVASGVIEKIILFARRYFSDAVLPESAINLLDAIVASMLTQGKRKLTDKIVAEFLAEKLSLPVEFFAQSEQEKVVTLYKKLNAVIYGQTQATHCLQQILEAKFLQLTNSLPLMMLFVGPIGVGKSTTAKELVKLLYGKTDFLLQLDMSEYQRISELDILLQKIKGFAKICPYAVCLFEQIDKANPRIIMALQKTLARPMIDDADITKVIFIMTMELTPEVVQQNQLVRREQLPQNELLQLVLEDLPGVQEPLLPVSNNLPMAVRHIEPVLKQYYGEQFYHDMAMVPFVPLTEKVLADLIKKQLDAIAESLSKNHKLGLQYNGDFIKEALKLLAEQQHKAADICQLIKQYILPVISDTLIAMAGQNQQASIFLLTLERDRVKAYIK